MLYTVKQIIFATLVILTGCSISRPPTSIHQPMTAKPVANRVVAADGGIFHAGNNERPLFEDVRARNVGDILTITLAEQTSGTRQSSGGSSNASTVSYSSPSMTRNATNVLNPFTVNGSTNNKTALTDAGAGSDSLTGTITVTVIEVMANGNLLVSGEKQLGLNQSDEFIRFSGVVYPASISTFNTVVSTQVADAHVEYKNAGAMNQVVNDAKSLGFLGRFFQSVLP